MLFCLTKKEKYVLMLKTKQKYENHLKHISLHMRRTCLTRHVSTRTSYNSIPPTRLLAIPKS